MQMFIARNHIFTFSNFSLKQPVSRWVLHIKPEDCQKFVKIIVKLDLQAFLQNFEIRKMPKFGFSFQDL